MSYAPVARKVVDLPTQHILRVLEGGLWGVAVLLYGLGDVLTTAVALQLPQTWEAKALAGQFYQTAGVTGLLIHKVLALLALVALWALIAVAVEQGSAALGHRIDGSLVRWVVPALAVHRGLTVVAHNAAVVLSAS